MGIPSKNGHSINFQPLNGLLELFYAFSQETRMQGLGWIIGLASSGNNYFLPYLRNGRTACLECVEIDFYRVFGSAFPRLS